MASFVYIEFFMFLVLFCCWFQFLGINIFNNAICNPVVMSVLLSVCNKLRPQCQKLLLARASGRKASQ